jgi:hypothetical protein
MLSACRSSGSAASTGRSAARSCAGRAGEAPVSVAAARAGPGGQPETFIVSLPDL